MIRCGAITREQRSNVEKMIDLILHADSVRCDIEQDDSMQSPDEVRKKVLARIRNKIKKSACCHEFNNGTQRKSGTCKMNIGNNSDSKAGTCRAGIAEDPYSSEDDVDLIPSGSEDSDDEQVESINPQHDDSNSSDTSDEDELTGIEELYFAVRMQRRGRMSYPLMPCLEAEIKQIHADCEQAPAWETFKVEVKSFTAQRNWNVSFFSQYMPITVTSGNVDSLVITLWHKIDKDIVAFGLQQGTNSETLFVTAPGLREGPVILQKCDTLPSDVPDSGLESDNRFLHKVHDRFLSSRRGIVFKAAFNPNLHLSVNESGLLSLVKTSNDFMQWEIEHL